jgi:hypothetical protein
MSEKKDKKPDIIVWDEERGYYAKGLSYPSDLGAPVIHVDDVKGWRQREVVNVNHVFESKLNEIKEEYNKLISEYDLNQFIYTNVEYSFIPVIGHKYHLYKRESGSYFLSLIGPESWKKEFIFSVTLNSSNKWVKS